jgi:hypothetical protein
MTAATNNLIKAEVFQGYFDKRANAEAQRLYLAAIEADPSFARPCADLAYALLQAYLYNWYEGSPLAVIGAMNARAQEALTKDPDDFYNLWIAADVALYSQDFDRAVAHYATLGAPALNKPMAAEEWAFRVDYADLLLLTGDPDQAVDIVKDAIQKAPFVEKWFYWVLGWAYYRGGWYQESLDALAHFRVPRNAIRKNVIASLVGLGNVIEAQAQAQIFLDEEKAQGIAYADPGQPVLAGLMQIEDRIPFKDPNARQKWKDDLAQAFNGLTQP